MDVTVRVDLVLQTVLVGTQLNAEALYKRRRCAWVILDCHLAVQLNQSMQGFRSYSVASFRKHCNIGCNRVYPYLDLNQRRAPEPNVRVGAWAPQGGRV